MNNKGFAITGIIYTLFIIFLMILLSVMTGLSSYQRLMVHSVESLESSFEGKKITGDELNKIKTEGIANYTGKYVFDLIVVEGDEWESEKKYTCSAYLYKEFNFKEAFADETITLSPSDCNDYSYDYGSNIELSAIYSFEGEN